MNSAGRFVRFIRERHAIYERRAAGKLKPWTQDEILQTYRFCNVYRELDSVTQWIATHIRTPFQDHPHLWFMLAIARQINWPDTLEELLRDRRGAWPDRRWNPERLRQVMLARQRRGEKLYTGAYMLTCARPRGYDGPGDKAAFTAHCVLAPLWAHREQVRGRTGRSLAEAVATLSSFYGFSGFLAGQVVADLKYAPALAKASDWWTYAVSGPGSRRGLNRVLERAPDARFGSESEWLSFLTELRGHTSPRLTALPSALHAQDLQNCLCEFDKYERVRLGEGRPRSHYPGKE